MADAATASYFSRDMPRPLAAITTCCASNSAPYCPAEEEKHREQTRFIVV